MCNMKEAALHVTDRTASIKNEFILFEVFHFHSTMTLLTCMNWKLYPKYISLWLKSTSSVSPFFLSIDIQNMQHCNRSSILTREGGFYVVLVSHHCMNTLWWGFFKWSTSGPHPAQEWLLRNSDHNHYKCC